jgi:hypothetical protein
MGRSHAEPRAGRVCHLWIENLGDDGADEVGQAVDCHRHVEYVLHPEGRQCSLFLRCPPGLDRDALAADYHRDHKLAGVQPGSILRPCR